MLLCHVLVVRPQDMCDLVSPTRDQNYTSCTERRSLNHWTSMGVPIMNIIFSINIAALVTWRGMHLIFPVVHPSGHYKERPSTICQIFLIKALFQQLIDNHRRRKTAWGGRINEKNRLYLKMTTWNRFGEKQTSLSRRIIPALNGVGLFCYYFPIPALTYFITNCFFKPHQWSFALSSKKCWKLLMKKLIMYSLECKLD